MQLLLFSLCAGASSEALWIGTHGADEAKRCFLVEQLVECGAGSRHTLHFYTSSFGEALATSDVAYDSGWEHCAIYLMPRAFGPRTQRLKIESAFDLRPHGFLCRLDNGLEVLAPYGEDGEEFFAQGMQGNVPVQVYGQQMAPRAN